MVNKFLQPALVFIVAAAIWTTSVQLSAHLGASATQTKQPEGQELSAELQALKDQFDAAPERSDLGVRYARALVQEAETKEDTSYLMLSVAALTKILSTQPNNSDALLLLADICLRAGIADKAAEYYKRYVTLNPDDIQARTDYALSLLQSNQGPEAVNILEGIVKEKPKLFPVRLSLALAYRVSGKLDAAEAEAKLARELAPDETGRKNVDEFLVSISDLKSGKSDSASPSAVEQPSEAVQKTASPAILVTSFFRNHPIVGPKITAITWPAADIAQIEVHDFPVEKMPPFAREKFIQNTKTAIGLVETPLSIHLVDDVSKKLLLSIDIKNGGIPAS